MWATTIPYCKSARIVLGSFSDSSPPTVNKLATKNIGTRQYTSTSSPNAKFPRMAAIRPTLINTPDAVDLMKKKSLHFQRKFQDLI